MGEAVIDQLEVCNSAVLYVFKCRNVGLSIYAVLQACTSAYAVEACISRYADHLSSGQLRQL